ncbi:MAG: tetratricopeptide repeat protein [Pseudomonadota bacterium]
MRAWELCAAMLAAALLWSAQAMAQSGDDASELRRRLSVVDAEVQALKAAVGETAGIEGAAAGAAGVTGEMILRLGQIEAELARLTGKVEQLEFRMRLIAEDATRRFGDIDFRLTELEGGDLSALGETAPLGGSETSGTEVAGLTEAEVSVSEREDLNRAINDVQQGRFDLAEDRLRQFLAQYSGSPLTSKALFWLGESQLVRGAYRDAASSYLRGYNLDRQGELAPDNLFKLGVTLGRLGQINEACLTLREVRIQFPESGDDLVGAADDEADRLACG